MSVSLPNEFYIFRANEKVGPFTLASLHKQVQTKLVTLDDLIWWEGQPDLKPIRETILGPLFSQDKPSASAAVWLGIAALLWGITGFSSGIVGLVLGFEDSFSSGIAVLFFICIGRLLCPIASSFSMYLAARVIKNERAYGVRKIALTGMILGIVGFVFWIIPTLLNLHRLWIWVLSPLDCSTLVLNCDQFGICLKGLKKMIYFRSAT